eukprot:TRINITY_DN70353_c0_g1_i1.p1 TRINITY_DN70353_c0_g1~~TRINITY_DN70353_c0_g1_i1.p1  ORF type:complete len:231 (+),score=31.71 TRINITY_DN70353_c0_g1_i1:1-693(+)
MMEYTFLETVNEDNDTAFLCACRNGNPNIAQHLHAVRDTGAIAGNAETALLTRALHLSAGCGCLELVRWFTETLEVPIDAGGELHSGEHEVPEDAIPQHMVVPKFCRGWQDGDTPVHVKKMYYSTALMFAAHGGGTLCSEKGSPFYEVVRYLLSHGADELEGDHVCATYTTRRKKGVPQRWVDVGPKLWTHHKRQQAGKGRSPYQKFHKECLDERWKLERERKAKLAVEE